MRTNINAVCEIFHVTADWLLRGAEVEEEDEKDVFMTPEAGEMAANAWLRSHFKVWVTFGEITDVEVF